MAEQDMQQEFLKAYDAYAEPIFRHCFFRVYSKVRAEELMQETFLRLWQYMNKDRIVENVRALLYRIANNLVIDESRKRKEESLDALMAEPNVFEPHSEDHYKLQQGVLFREVVAEFAKVPANYRQVLMLRYIDDLDPKEIAEVLGLSVNNVSVRLNRGTKALRNNFKNHKPQISQTPNNNTQ